MSHSDRHAVERAAWAVRLKATLKDHFIYKEHLNDYSNMLMVTHKDSPGWKAKLTISTVAGARNRVDLDGKSFSYSARQDMCDKLLSTLMAHRGDYDAKLARTVTAEVTNTQWMQKQDTELTAVGLNSLDDVDIEIITKGPHMGNYCVTLLDGNPLEHLTLEQLKIFGLFLKSIRS